MLNNKDIPAPYYKRAAELMSALPNVEFYDIVEVLYESDKWIAKESKRISAELDNKDRPSGMKWENPVQTETPKKDTKEKHRRLQERAIIVHGKKYTFRNMKKLAEHFNIKSIDYDYIVRNNLFSQKDSVVQNEAKRVRKILEKYGFNLESFTAYDFERKIITVNYV